MNKETLELMQTIAVTGELIVILGCIITVSWLVLMFKKMTDDVKEK